MKNFIKTKWLGLFVAAWMVVGLTACDNTVSSDGNASFTDQEVATLSAELTAELALSASQQSSLNGTLLDRESQSHEPGFLWYVAADLQANLTQEQKDSLYARTENMEGGARFRGMGGAQGPGDFQGIGGFQGGVDQSQGFGGGGFGGPGGFPGANGPRTDGSPRPGGMHGPHDGAALDSLLNLTEEQKASLEEIRQNYSGQIDALIESKRNGDLTVEEFRSEIKALRDAEKVELDAVLTDEQKATLDAYMEEKKAEMEAQMAERQAAFEEYMLAVKVARNEALGLSDDQITALDAFQEAQKSDRDALIQQFKDGTIGMDEMATEMDILAAAEDDFLANNLNDTQLEVVRIHDALSVRARRIAMGPGRGGSGLGGVNGPGQGRGGFGGPTDGFHRGGFGGGSNGGNG